MLKRLTTAFIAMCLILPTAPAFAHSILWAAISDHTDLVKDEEYEAVPAVLFMALAVEDDTVPLIEETDSGLEILYEELDSPELTGVEDIPVPPEPISVEEEPEAPEEIELEEIINDEIQIP